MTVATGLFMIMFVGVLTYAMRAGVILALAGRTLSPTLLRALRYVAPAVLAALVVSLVADPAAANQGITIPEVGGIIAGCPVALRTRNLIATLAAGMTVFWILLALT